MVKRRVAKEADSYVAEQLDITYTIPKGLAHMLASASGKSIKEIWLTLSEMANICAFRLNVRAGRNNSSWTTKKFPETEITLRIDMDKYVQYNYSNPSEVYKPKYSARIKISGYSNETFTQAQVNEYITEGILLGDDEEETIL